MTSKAVPLGKKGYTLIELIIVVVLIGLLASLTMPRFRYAILTDELKRTTRRLVAVIKNVRNEAIREQQSFALHLDVETNRFWVDSAGMGEEERVLAREKAVSLPASVRIIDVWSKGKGKKAAGEIPLHFSKQGYVEQSAIHLGSEDGREFTLVLSPFLGTIKVLDKYVGFEDT